MKKLIKLGLVVVVLFFLVVGGCVFWVLSNIDSLAKKGIEAGGTYALGVQTTVQGVSLHLLAGNMAISGLTVANPQGFTSPAFLNLSSGDVAVSLGSLNSDVIEIPTFSLKGIDVNLERKEKSANYKVILDNLGKLKSSSGSAPASSGGTSKKLIVKNLELSDIKIHVDMLGMGGGVGKALDSATAVNVPIDRVQLTNVGQAGDGAKGSGVTVEQLTSLIVQAVLAAAADRGGGVIPAEILGDLKGGVGALGGLAGVPINVVGKTGEAATKLGEGAVKAVDDAAKKLGDGLGGLLPGSKPKDKKDEPKKP